MPLIEDPRYTASAIVGPVRQELFAQPQTEEPKPPLLDTVAAAARSSTVAGAAYEFLSTARDPTASPAPPGYDPLNDIAGFENDAKRFVGADSPAEVASIKERISQERRDRETLQRAGLGGPVASIALNLLDPSFLAAAAVPELAFAKAARVSKLVTAAARGATGAAAYEAAMQTLQEDRTLTESAVNIGAGALLGGVIGSIGRTAPSAESRALLDAVRRELAGDVRSTVGAAASGVATTAEQETIARGGGILNKILGGVPLARTDLQVVLGSESVEARRVLQELADVSPILQKNVEGIASPTSVESLVGRHEGRVADFVDFLKDAWARYRARVPSSERMSEADFRAAVAGAARRGDTSVEPEVAEASKYLRSRVFDPLKDEATQLKLLPPNAEVVGAESYFRRMYDRESIRKSRREWDDVLTNHFMRQLRRAKAQVPIGGETPAPKELPPLAPPAAMEKRSQSVADPAHDSVLEYISKKGGINSEAATSEGIDPADIKSARGHGIRRPFTKEGMSLDQAAEVLHEAGYPVADEAGHYSANRVLDILDEELRGKRVYSSRNRSHDAEMLLEAERKYGGEREPTEADDEEAFYKGLPTPHRTDAGAAAEYEKAVQSGAKLSPGEEYAEARSIAEDVTRRILGQDVGQANFNVRLFAPKAGPLHERVLDIPDELIEKYLVNDPVKVAQSYTRAMAPEVELAKRFGDKDMTAAFQRVKDEYDVLRERVRSSTEGDTSKALSKLSENEKRTLEALSRVRDRITGQAGRLGPDASEGARKAVEFSRGWRNIVASARLGVAALTSAAQDTGRIVAQYGFLPTVAKVAKLATSSDFRALSKAQARRLGAAVEVTLARRVNVAYDGAATEGWTQALANGVYKYSGLNHWTDFGRTLSATLLEDKVLKLASKVAEGGEVTGWARTRLAALGIDHDALKAIAKEVEKHGSDVGGVRVSGSANWDDAALAERYDAALLKEARQTVMQPGAADKTWWMDSETGKVIGQLKSFALAAPVRFAMVPAQMLGQRNAVGAARFVGAMMAGGALAHVLRSYEAGKTPQTDPKQLAFEAFNEAGLAGTLPDIVSPLARRFGVLGESARYSDRNVLSAVGGPALGTIGDVYDLAFNRTAGGISASDLHAIRRLLPFQNLWYLRRAINALEGETAEELALQGAGSKTFGQRFAETTPLAPPGKRGANGMVAQVN